MTTDNQIQEELHINGRKTEYIVWGMEECEEISIGAAGKPRTL